MADIDPRLMAATLNQGAPTQAQPQTGKGRSPLFANAVPMGSPQDLAQQQAVIQRAQQQRAQGIQPSLVDPGKGGQPPPPQQQQLTPQMQQMMMQRRQAMQQQQGMPQSMAQHRMGPTPGQAPPQLGKGAAPPSQYTG